MSTTPITDAANKIAASSPNIRAFALEVAARLEPPAPPPAALPYLLTLRPNWNNGADANDVAHNYNAVWVWSNNAQGYAPPNGRDPYRVLLLDPRLKDAKGRAGVDEWWAVIRRYWPSSFDPTKHGAWGTEANFHNVASGIGPVNSGGVGWGFGSGVSALALNWRPQDAAPSIALEYAKSGGLAIPLPTPARDVPHEYALRFVAGRTDGSTVRPGELDVIADGRAVSMLRGINTVQAAVAPADGKTYVQAWLAAAWDGDYTADLANDSTTGFALTGVGPTLAAAEADVPIAVAGTFGSQAWNGRQPNHGPPALVTLP